MKSYQFIPAYYEWHFVDAADPDNVLLNMQDPIDSLYKGGDSDELMDDIDEVRSMCEDYINTTRENLELEHEECDVNGNTLDGLDELPANAADIMAQALYNHYIA